MERIWIIPVLVVLIVGSLGFSQEAFAAGHQTFITDEPSCENAPVLGDFQSGTCVLDDTHTIPLGTEWLFVLESKVTGTVDVFGQIQFRADASNSGTINVIGDPGGSPNRGLMVFVFGTEYTNECSGIINLIGGEFPEVGFLSGTLRIIGQDGFAPVFSNFGTINGIDSDPVQNIAIVELITTPDIVTFNNHGTLTAPVAFFGNSIFNDNLPNQCVVGGTYIPIDTTSLLLAGASVNAWMIPVLLSAAGFGILIARKI